MYVRPGSWIYFKKPPCRILDGRKYLLVKLLFFIGGARRELSSPYTYGFAGVVKLQLLLVQREVLVQRELSVASLSLLPTHTASLGWSNCSCLLRSNLKGVF